MQVPGEKQIDMTIQEEKVEYRRKRVYLLKNKGYSNREISEKINVSLSTVEKDLKEIRHQIKDWFDHISKNESHNAFVSSILQLELVLNKLWNYFRQEKDQREARKILLQIADTACKRTKLFQFSKYLSEYSEDLQTFEKNPKSFSFLDLLEEENK